MDEITLNTGKGVKQPSLSELEGKIDKILVYQKRVARVAVFRGVISFIFFLVFIVLPIIGGFYLFGYLKEKVDFNKISTQYKEFYDTVSVLNQAKGQIKDIEKMVTPDSLKNLINGSNPQAPANQ